MDPKTFNNEVTIDKETRSYELTKKSDIYSLGVLFWELTSCSPPFDFETKNNSEYALISAILNGKREKPIENTNSKFVNLYQSGYKNFNIKLLFL